MVELLKGKGNFVRFILLLVAMSGGYLLVAWASYSPLDNAWSVASSVTQNVLNKTGGFGAWLIDILLAMFGHIACLIPCTLIFLPIYFILTQKSASLTYRQAVLWCFGFVLLMVGLSGLAGALLSDSATYLAGGFIGAMLANTMGGVIGVFGTLLFSMVLTAIGFYCCSGQILLQLFNRLYGWIMEEKGEAEQTATHSSQQGDSKENNNESSLNPPLSNERENDELSFQTPKEPSIPAQLTDISLFTRPKITGLNTPMVNTQPVTKTEDALFKVENQVVLPKVSVPELLKEDIKKELKEELKKELNFTEIALVKAEQQEPVIFGDENVSFPTIRLNPLLQESEEPKPINLVKESDEKEIKPAITVENNFETAPEFLKPERKVILPEPIEENIQAVSNEQNITKPSYPKGYGDSLIHPLLERKRELEKPKTPLPTLDLLEENRQETQQITEQEILDISVKIEKELANFGVKATVEDVLVGPVVTRYEIKPAAGVKASKITNLESDLARSLIFKAIRITDVVPGKPFMGIETPNRHRQTVWLRDVLDSEEFRNSKAILPMALGKDISGQPVVVDMAEMPHLLVAGQTGGGKSVGVNTMILSLLFKFTPEQVQFIMIDPKVVELSIYNDIPHLLTPVVTDMKKAENALRWAVDEMERRYLLVSSLRVRNIESYNNKIDEATAMDLPIPNPLWRPGDTMDTLPPALKKMSYIVLIVDEFADLMMSVGKQVEDHIMRIAQKARAVGIHLILATQRPSTDVITGVIKANIPSRIAFTVATQIDSRTILDKGGAESLLGRGDMLYSGARSPEIIRIHGAFMSDDDVQRVAENWRARGKPEYIESITESAEENSDVERNVSNELDPLFDEIVQYVIESNVTSISGIQRRFSIGFNRAARIIDQMEDQRILSAADNRGKREVLAR